MTSILKNRQSICTMLMSLLMVCMCQVAFAKAQPIWLEMNQSYLYHAGNSKITRVTVANPAIADVIVLGLSDLNIVAKARGSTTPSVWSANNMRQDFIISVSQMDSTSAKHIENIIGSPGVTVNKVGDKIILKGVVENQVEMEHAVGIAEAYSSKENVINLLQMKNPTLINLAALVIDIDTVAAKDLGFQYANASKIDSSSSSGKYNASDITFGTPGQFFGGMNFHSLTGKVFANVDMMVQALITSNKARVLSRPNITTLSGKEAEILIGGEIPIPTSNNGDVSVTWREYGIKLHIKPVADQENKILTDVTAEVSSLDKVNSVTTTAGTIPALTSRKASTTINLPDGQCMAIGGLMNSQDSKVITKVPLLSSIPIIGEFFKHTSTTKDQREIMILITPTIVDSNTPVRGGREMDEALNDHKLEYANMKELYPNDPPVPKEDKKAKSKNQTIVPVPGNQSSKSKY